MNTSTTVTSRDIQSDNFKRLTAGQLSRAEQLVMNAVLLGHARRQRDFSLNELCLVMEEQLGRRVNPNGISGRVTSLVDSGRLARAESRACSVTGKPCNPVFAVARQVDLRLVPARPDIRTATPAPASTSTGQVASQARSSGVPPEVRAKLAALKLSAERGR